MEDAVSTTLSSPVGNPPFNFFFLFFNHLMLGKYFISLETQVGFSCGCFYIISALAFPSENKNHIISVPFFTLDVQKHRANSEVKS